MPKQTIERDRLVDTAYDIAERDGLSALSIRRLASECSISIGSVYNFFPAKTDLTTAVVERFFRAAIVDEFCRVEPGEGFVDYLRRLEGALVRVLGEYRTTWLKEIRKLPYEERTAGRAAQAARLGHIETGLARVLAADPDIEPAALVGPLAPKLLCSFIAEHLLAAVQNGTDCATLFALLDSALYGESATRR